MSARVYYFDVLRTFATFSVVVAHVASWMVLEFKPIVTIDWWVGSFVSSAARYCLPVFIMISGAALLDPSKQESIKVFFKKRVRRILIPTLFWSAFYITLKATWMSEFFYEQVTFKAVVRDILDANMWYHIWYLYVATGFYFLTPFLRRYVRNTARERRIVIAVFMLIVGIVWCVINHIYRYDPISHYDRHVIFLETIPYLGYYLAGYELSLVDRKKINLRYVVIAIVLSIMAAVFGAAFYIRVWGVERSSISYHQLNVPIIVMSISAFLLVYRICGKEEPAKSRVLNLTRKVLPTTMGIYVMHPVILELIRRIAVFFGAGKEVPTDGPTSVIGIPLISAITIYVCYKITQVLMKVPYVRRIVA